MFLIDVNETRAIIVKGLRDHLNVPIIRSNQTGQPPAYPYLSYTITTLTSQNNGSWGVYDDGIERRPITQTWSITVQSDDYSEAVNLSLKAREWFDHDGAVYLNDNEVIVQSVSAIANRDNLISVEYEYRNGFDVFLWMLDEAQGAADIAGAIETVGLNKQTLVPKTAEDWNDLLERRLE